MYANRLSMVFCGSSTGLSIVHSMMYMGLFVVLTRGVWVVYGPGWEVYGLSMHMVMHGWKVSGLH